MGPVALNVRRMKDVQSGARSTSPQLLLGLRDKSVALFSRSPDLTLGYDPYAVRLAV
jgi:hypothetical protein